MKGERTRKYNQTKTKEKDLDWLVVEFEGYCYQSNMIE